MYLDEILVVNLAMNYLILWLTARLSRRNYHFNRLFWGALLGALYVLTVFLPAKSVFLTITAKLILSIVIIYVSFLPLKARELFSLLGVFYLVSFTAGGAVLAWSLFLSVPVLSLGGTFVISPVSSWNLVIPFFLILFLGKWGLDYLEQKKWQRLFKVILLIKVLGKEIEIKGIMDTGNKLKEPISREPVIVVQYSALEEILPEDVKEYYKEQNEKSLELDIGRLSDSPLASRICFIPYSSLGKKKGFLLGFRPEGIKLWEKGREVEVLQKAVIAIYFDSFSDKTSYQALLPPSLLANVS